MRILRSDWASRPPEFHPYTWLATEAGGLFAADAEQELANTFPVDSFERRVAAPQGDKQYRNHSRQIESEASPQDMLLPASWRNLILDLRSADYRRTVARILQQPVAPAVALRLVRHAPGDFVGAHTDRPDKLFSHILYFNADWQPDYGGFFEILDGASTVVARVMPALGTSVLLARSDHSWHRVSPVVAGNAPERRSLLIHGVVARTR